MSGPSNARILLWCAVSLIFPSIARTQGSVESKKLSSHILKHVVPKTAHAGDSVAAFGLAKGFAGHAKSFAATSGLPVDSVANWSDQFITPGFDFLGNHQSVWPYTMVGTPPESGISTHIPAPIVPVTLELLGLDENVAVYQGHRLVFSDTPEIVTAVANSPVFQPFAYASGSGQFNDVMMRTQFWDRIHHSSGDDEGDVNSDNNNSDNEWHIKLKPSVKTTRHMRIPYGFWYFFVDANNVPVAAAVDANTFGYLLFPQTYPVDNSTPIGAAELAGDVTTHDISTLLFNNVYLYIGKINNCCILGFHSYDWEPGDSSNGKRDRRYVLDFASWLDAGAFSFGFEDITPFSHEMSEIFDDPFVNNATPWWLSADPSFGFVLCQDNMETGDATEILSGNPVYATAMNGRTYHPQNEALLPWFAFQSPSRARHGAYSFPDETTMTTLSPSNLLPGCSPAP